MVQLLKRQILVSQRSDAGNALLVGQREFDTAVADVDQQLHGGKACGRTLISPEYSDRIWPPASMRKAP